MEIKFETSKRPVIKGKLNGMEHYFLLDTGASVGMIDSHVRGLHSSWRKLAIVDASGDEIRCPILNDVVEIGGRKLSQFLACDLSGVRSSIFRETGVGVNGIIGFGQLLAMGAVIDIGNRMLKM